MDKKYLIINIGSTSKKYALYSDKELFFINLNEDVELILKLLISKNLIVNKNEISGIGIRIVAPGDYFLDNKFIDNSYLLRLKKAEEIAPLHIKPVLSEIQKLKILFPSIPIIGISDSAFHKYLPEISKNYALPKNITKKFEIYKFGYHGISISSILSQLKNIPKKIIICHLGGGSSVTAIKNGKSFDTSMGFTPLEGIYGSTRIGDIDPGALIYLSKKFNSKELEDMVNNKSGLLALGNSDMKVLLKSSKKAVDTYVYKVKKYIGSYIAALNGVDLIIFSGAIGENSEIIQSKICEGFIQEQKIKISVVKSNEMEEIAKQTKIILNSKHS